MASISGPGAEIPRAGPIGPGSLGDDAASNRRKRKSGSPLPSNKSDKQPKFATRQRITRACDSCKIKKTRCTGTLPCTRCTRLSLPCRYNAAYSRGLPPTPLPASQGSGYSEASRDGSTAPSSDEFSHRAASIPRDAASRHLGGSGRQVVSVRNSPEPGSTDFEGNYIGPASGISFINRVWSRLHQDEKASVLDDLQNASSKNTAVFSFGDNPYSYDKGAEFLLPTYDKAMELVAIYFDFSMVTYRFLHRGQVENWVKCIYEDNISATNLPTGNMVARTAIVLTLFAVSTLHADLQPGRRAGDRIKSEHWFAASKHISSIESGPPRLETIQVRLIQCLYLLSSSRANECWYSFGTALQVVTALGLHRKSPAKRSNHGISYLELQIRKRIFWSVYTLDKYLSIMFGRPRLLHDEDIDQELPDELNDEDLLEEDPSRRTGSADSMMIASVLHYRLGRILGGISRQLYSINPISRDSPLDTAVRLTSELEKWKESVPPIFNSVRPASLIPPLCRQSHVLQLAYSHAMIHVTRSFLLTDFTDLSRRPHDSNSIVSSHVQKCIQAAEDILTIIEALVQQNTFIPSFWFTHYICFCAILVVYIHIIQQQRQSVGSSPFHGHLAEATRKNSPSRRYSIILEELRREVHRQMGSDARSDIYQRPVQPEPESLVQGALAPNGDQAVTLGDQSVEFEGMSGLLQAPEFGINPVEDAGLFESLEGSIWWAQLDSWALSNFPSDSFSFNF
ncbi:hypothetical protein N7468_010063 [Penicillium chermesinum]|uniref:Zn(2)-C6 fungal-type domain-containing protein n=1 Tax=Penicillium chermesinum TaxID=63820 RepID=A0A9W9TCZ9_9EURO|nr:uncharacterized protein N7468_010063 [Penicillium chermesinum]KAJ5217055.1 hypothetical protein N7468_010063 [Penicillium chermesinum]